MNRINFGWFNAKSLIFCSCTFRSFFCQHLWVSAELILSLSLPCFHLDILNDFKDMTYHCYTDDIHLYKKCRIYKNVLKNWMAANYFSLKKSFLSLLAFFPWTHFILLWKMWVFWSVFSFDKHLGCFVQVSKKQPRLSLWLYMLLPDHASIIPIHYSFA